MTTEGGGAVDVGNSGGAGNTDGNGQGNSGVDNSGNAPGTGTTDVFASLSEENRAFAQQKGLSAEQFDINKVFDMHRNADKLISQGAHKQTQPAGGQTGDGSEVPANPAGYEFKMPDGMPEGMAYDNSFASKFADWAHNQGMSKAGAQQIHDFYVQHVGEHFSSSTAQQTEQLNTRVTETFDTLTKEWGQPETPAFQRNLELSRRAMSNLHPDFKQALVDAGVIRVDGAQEVVTDARIMMGLQKAGSTMFAEDSVFGGKPADVNPFDPKTSDLTAQGDLVRENPDLAKQLIRAAGVQEDWGHFLNK